MEHRQCRRISEWKVGTHINLDYILSYPFVTLSNVRTPRT